jgi:ubiquinone/menaquinone biosynthesis C-methylase UbiE
MGRTEDIRDFWDKKVEEKGLEVSATAFDFQLKNLEVHYISKFFEGIKGPVKVLDLGCGTGYLGVVLLERFPGVDYTGVDYGPTVVKYAQQRIVDLKVKGKIRFMQGNAVDVVDMFQPEEFDIIITERLLINLGSKENQDKCIDGSTRILKKGGHWLMLEGTVEGWQRLNKYRKMYGLHELGNSWHQTKVEEKNLLPQMRGHGYSLLSRQCFGMYYFLSRVVHPLDIKPKEPHYDDAFNETAREIAKKIPDYDEIGHLRFYTFSKGTSDSSSL